MTGIGEELSNLGQGVASFGHSTVTRFPAILASEFSDLIGDHADSFPGFGADFVNFLDDQADEFKVNMMDSYYQTVQANEWDTNDSFMFKIGSGS